MAGGFWRQCNSERKTNGAFSRPSFRGAIIKSYDPFAVSNYRTYTRHSLGCNKSHALVKVRFHLAGETVYSPDLILFPFHKRIPVTKLPPSHPLFAEAKEGPLLGIGGKKRGSQCQNPFRVSLFLYLSLPTSVVVSLVLSSGCPVLHQPFGDGERRGLRGWDGHFGEELHQRLRRPLENTYLDPCMHTTTLCVS